MKSYPTDGQVNLGPQVNQRTRSIETWNWKEKPDQSSTPQTDNFFNFKYKVQ